jgi:hypothetical protein
MQSSSDYSYINICDFKATLKQVVFQDLRFSIGIDEDTFLLGCDAISIIK